MKRRQKLVPWLAIAAFGLAVAGSVFAQQADNGHDMFLAEQLSGPPPVDAGTNRSAIYKTAELHKKTPANGMP